MMGPHWNTELDIFFQGLEVDSPVWGALVRNAICAPKDNKNWLTK